MTRVSVCLCTFNGEAVVLRALESILAQSHGDFELLVLDDGSSDGTLERVRGVADPRLRVVVNSVNLGNARNRSRAIQLSSGEFIKFVDQDDWIARDCLAEHLALMEAAPSVGLTFSRRAINVDGLRTAEVQAWLARYATLAGRIGPLAEVNSGNELLSRHIEHSFDENWVGEPTSVLIRRAVLDHSQLFNRRLHQKLDIDLWIRLMAFSDVGFLDAELATRSLSPASASELNRHGHRHWLDGLWLLEGLSSFEAVWRQYPKLAELREMERKSLVVATATGRFRTESLREAVQDDLAYFRFLMRRLSGHPEALLDRLGPAPRQVLA